MACLVVAMLGAGCVETPLEEKSTWTLEVPGQIIRGETAIAATATLVVHETIKYQGSGPVLSPSISIPYDGRKSVTLYEYGSECCVSYAYVVTEQVIAPGTYEFPVHWNGRARLGDTSDGTRDPHQGDLLSPGTYTIVASIRGPEKTATAKIELI